MPDAPGALDVVAEPDPADDGALTVGALLELAIGVVGTGVDVSGIAMLVTVSGAGAA